MSKFVKVQTELRDVTMIKRALEDLKLSYQENARYVHPFGGFAGTVPLVVKAPRAVFGMRQSEEGVYEVIGDDMQMQPIRATLQQVQQRYAYHKVLAETDLAGFSLVEEQTGRDGVIRMTVRRWG